MTVPFQKDFLWRLADDWVTAWKTLQVVLWSQNSARIEALFFLQKVRLRSGTWLHLFMVKPLFSSPSLSHHSEKSWEGRKTKLFNAFVSHFYFFLEPILPWIACVVLQNILPWMSWRNKTVVKSSCLVKSSCHGWRYHFRKISFEGWLMTESQLEKPYRSCCGVKTVQESKLIYIYICIIDINSIFFFGLKPTAPKNGPLVEVPEDARAAVERSVLQLLGEDALQSISAAPTAHRR